MENRIEMKIVSNIVIDELEGEVINIIASLEGSPNLQYGIKDLTDLLINSNKYRRVREKYSLPIEFKLIKYLSSSPTLLLDYLNGYAMAKEEDNRLTNQTATRILSATDDQIKKGVFRDIGPAEDCYNAAVFYIKQQQQECSGKTHSILPIALSELKMLLDMNDTVSFNRSWYSILNEIKTTHPALFSSQQENESLLIKSERMLGAAKEFIKAGNFNDIENESVCIMLILDYIKLTENVKVASPVFPQLYKELLVLAALNRDIELKTVLRKIIMDVKSHKQLVLTPELTQQEQNTSEERKRQVANIVTNVVSMDIHDDIDDRFGCIFSIITLLFVSENHMHSNNANEKIEQLSTVHGNILTLNQTGKETELNMYIRKLLIIAKTPFALTGLNAASLRHGYDLSKSKIVENVLSLVATLVISWFCTLHVLAPEPFAFKFGNDYDEIQFDHPLLNPSLSSWLVISIVVIIVFVGFLVWNVFCVVSLRKTFHCAIKDLVNTLVPIAIGNVFAFATANAFALISPPFWVTLSIFSLVGVGAHLVVRLIVSQVVRLIHYKLVGYIEIQNAFNLLNVSPTGVYTEVCKAYNVLEKISRNSSKDNLPTANRNIVKINRPGNNELELAVELIAREKLRNPKQTRFLKCLRSFW